MDGVRVAYEDGRAAPPSYLGSSDELIDGSNE